MRGESSTSPAGRRFRLISNSQVYSSWTTDRILSERSELDVLLSVLHFGIAVSSRFFCFFLFFPFPASSERGRSSDSADEAHEHYHEAFESNCAIGGPPPREAGEEEVSRRRFANMLHRQRKSG